MRRIIPAAAGFAASTVAVAAMASAALANAPQPTSIHIDSEAANANGTETITISGTWTWDQRVPTGPQRDCNDQRAGVGYAVAWGDNTNNPLKTGNTTIYVGDVNDDWVHSVSESPWSLTSSTGGANMSFDGPFKPSPSTVTESMTGETADAVANGFGPQGIPDGVTSAAPVHGDKYQWLSNCGPTAQSTLYGQTIGNSNPSNPQQGYPNGQWGPISHTYATAGSYTICPVMYDPHAGPVGTAQTDPGQLTAGGQNANGDNSVQSNNNPTGCPVVSTAPSPSRSSAPAPAPGFRVVKEQKIGSGKFTTSRLKGKVGERVTYKILVVNTGNTSLTFSSFTDAQCDAGTISGGPGTASVPAGGSSMYRCSHVLTKADRAHGSLANVATETGTPPGGSPITRTSNKVVVDVARVAHVKAKHISRKPRVSAGFTG